MCSKVYDRQLTQTDSKRSLNWLKWTHSCALRRLFYSTKPIYATHMLPWHPSSSKEFWWNSTGALYYSLRNLKKTPHNSLPILFFTKWAVVGKMNYIKWGNKCTKSTNNKIILVWPHIKVAWKFNTLWIWLCLCQFDRKKRILGSVQLIKGWIKNIFILPIKLNP